MSQKILPDFKTFSILNVLRISPAAGKFFDLNLKKIRRCWCQNMIYVKRRYQSKIRNRKLICSTFLAHITWQRNLWGFIGFNPFLITFGFSQCGANVVHRNKKNRNWLIFNCGFSLKVPRTRLELAHRNRHQPLKLACLPISPSGQSCKDKIQKLKVKYYSQFSSLCLESFTLRLPCAQNRTRTCTSLLTLVPETSASTNFAIWAICKDKR